MSCRCDLGAKNFHTMMSYGCKDFNSALQSTSLGLFSNPDIKVLSAGVPAGNASANAAKALRAYAGLMSKFSSSKATANDAG